MSKERFILGVGQPMTSEPVFSVSNERRRVMEDLGLWKSSEDAPEVFNKLNASNLECISKSKYICNVLTYNKGFVEVKPQNQAVKGFFEAYVAEMDSVRKSESSNGSECFFTEFKPLIKQFGALLVYITINTGYEPVIRYFVSSKYADVANEYVNMVFCRIRGREGLSGIFKFSKQLISKYTDDYTVLLDSEQYLAHNLKKEEREWLNRERKGKKMDFDEVILSNAFLGETEDIVSSYDGNIEGKALSERNRYLEDAKYTIEQKIDLITDFETLKEAKFAIEFIDSLIYGFEQYDKLKIEKPAIKGDLDLLKAHRGSILGVTGGRECNLKEARSRFLEFLNKNGERFSCLLHGGAHGFDAVAFSIAVNKGMDVIIASPVVKKTSDIPTNLLLNARLKGVKIGFIEPLKYNSERLGDKFRERNSVIASNSDLVVYYGLKNNSGTMSALYACDRYKTPYEEL